MKMTSSELGDENLKKMAEALKKAEREAVQKDKQISELLARLREYEMGEYGLAEAVAEIKECRRLLRLRDREIEALTDQLNASKLHVLNLREKLENLQLRVDLSGHETLLPLGKVPPPDTKKPKKVQKPKIIHVEKQPLKEDKMCQCYISIYPLNSTTRISSTQIQNEKLRTELRKVCEEATHLLMHMANDHRKSTSEYEAVISKLKENLETLELTIMRAEPLTHHESLKKKEEVVCQKSDSEDCYKSVLDRIEQEDIEVQEIFHELANQIKVLKQNQMTLVRQCQALSDYGIQMRKENEKLRRTFSSAAEFPSIQKYEVGYSASKLWEDGGKAFLHDIQLSNLTGTDCAKPECEANRNSIVKFIDLVTQFLKEIFSLKDLLAISHHQTKALESVCFEKETELRSAMEQLILFQIQSDERLLLGKLALKVLQLQFTNAACTYELEKYKLDRTALQEWYGALLKDHEENEIKLSTAYAKAHTKVKHLMEILEDVSQRCSKAVSSYEQSPL